jgi:hypothetical protein
MHETNEHAGPIASFAPGVSQAQARCELSVVMPCLNEAETIGTCIRKVPKPDFTLRQRSQSFPTTMRRRI